MIVCLKKQVGGLLASDEPLHAPGLIECDGRAVYRKDYPELCKGDKFVLMPDLQGVVPGVWFYVIGNVRNPWTA